MRILACCRNLFGATVISGMMMSSPVAINSQTLKKDSFELVTSKVVPSGTTDSLVLANAPSPSFKLQGKNKNATIVVDLTNNIMYHYDNNGKPMTAYAVATGAKSTPTHTGLRVVSHVETFPYKTAPQSSKRRQSPRDFGPNILILDTVDPKTGERGITGEFIHGNRNYEIVAKRQYASHGCIRVDNEIIKEFAKKIKPGSFVKIIKR